MASKDPAVLETMRAELPSLLRQAIRTDPSLRDDLADALGIGAPPDDDEAHGRGKRTIWDALEQLAGRVEELAAAQARTEKRLEQLAGRVDELAAAQARTEQRLEQLAAAQARTEQRLEQLAGRMDQLAAAQARTEQRVGDLVGTSLEAEYARKAGAVFGPIFRRARVVDAADVADAASDVLSDEDRSDVLGLDLVVEGVPRSRQELGPVWVAVEVSSVVDEHDVERAARRAAALRGLGRPVVAAVAGRMVEVRAGAQARALSVAVVVDGRSDGWDEALAAASPP